MVTLKFCIELDKAGVGPPFFYKRAILLHFPADMTGEEPQSVDTVLFLHATSCGHKLNCDQLIILIIIKCKFIFQVLSNPERATSEELKSRMRRWKHTLPTPVIKFGLQGMPYWL